MIRRLLIAALLTVVLIPAWGIGASTQEATTTGDAVPDAVPRVLDERAQVQHAKLVEHHESLVEQREQIEQALLDHQSRQARELGDRAPKETIAPMATIAPIEND